MKKCLFLVLLCLYGIMPVFSQDALYIYRNDGSFNAFPYSEIEKIAYSKLDIDGIQSEEVVTQEVWLPDSVYQIPLASIDSIGLKKLETVFAEEVKQMGSLVDYVVSVDDKTITFSSDLPEALQPKTGDVLFYDVCENPFPNGFAGKVTNVALGDQIVVSCTDVNLSDIYEQIVEYKEFETMSGTDASGARTRAATTDEAGETKEDIGGKDGFRIPLSVNFSPLDHLSTTIEGNVTVSTKGKFVKEILPGKPVYIDLSMTVDIKSDATIQVTGGGSKDFELFDKSIPFATLPAGIVASFKITPYMETSVEGALTHDFSTHTALTVGYRYQNQAGNVYVDHQSELTEGGTTIDGEIEAFLGVKAGLELSALAGIIKVGGYGTFGPWANAHFHAYNSEIDINDQYELSKNDVISSALRGQVEFSAEANFLDLVGAKAGQKWTNYFHRRERYAMPYFSQPEVTLLSENRKEASVSYEVSRDLLMPVQVGLALYDGDELVKREYVGSYQLQKDFTNNPFEVTFTELNPNKKYLCRPIVNAGSGVSSEYPATPTATIGETLTIVTDAEDDVKLKSAKAHGHIETDDIEAFRNYASGFRYSSDEATEKDTWETASAEAIDENGNFEAKLSELDAATTYYYCAFVKIGDEYIYGDTKSFESKQLNVITDEVKNIDAETPDANGHIESDFLETLDGLEYGIRYTTDPDAGEWISIRATALEGLNFSSSLTDLSKDVTYYYSAYIVYDDETYYGENKTFRLSSVQVLTGGYKVMSDTSVKLSGSYSESSDVTIVGFVYNSEGEPDMENGKVVEVELPSTEFNAVIDELEKDVTYYYRAFVKLGEDYVFADETKSFTMSGFSICPDENHPHMIDLGSGKKWSCCDAGASSPEQPGTKRLYTELPSWEAPWTVATHSDFYNMSLNTCEYYIYHGVKGTLVTGSNGNQIFFPYDSDGDLEGYAIYWTAEPVESMGLIGWNTHDGRFWYSPNQQNYTETLRNRVRFVTE